MFLGIIDLVDDEAVHGLKAFRKFLSSLILTLQLRNQKLRKMSILAIPPPQKSPQVTISEAMMVTKA